MFLLGDEGLKKYMSWVSNYVIAFLASVAVALATYLTYDLNRSARAEVVKQYNALQGLMVRQAVQESQSFLETHLRDLDLLIELPSLQNSELEDFRRHVRAIYHKNGHPLPASIEVLDGLTPNVATESGISVLSAETIQRIYAWGGQNSGMDRTFVSACTVPATTRTLGSAGTLVIFARRIPPLGASDDASVQPSEVGRFVVLAVDLETQLLNHLVGAHDATPHPKVWIMDRKGSVLLQSEHPEMLHANVMRVEPSCHNCHDSFDYALTMLHGTSGVVEYSLKAQPPRLAAYAPLRFADSDWVLVLNTPSSQVTEYARHNSARGLLVMGVAAVGLSLLWILVQRYRVCQAQARAEARHWQEEHRLAEELQRSERRYRTLFEQSPDGIVILDPLTGLPLDFNRAAHELLGHSREDFARMPVHSYEFGPDSEECTQNPPSWLNEESARVETRHRTRAGTFRSVEVISQTLDLAGKPIRYCIYHDVTEARQARQSLLERSRRLEALHRAGLGFAGEAGIQHLQRAICQEALLLFAASSSAVFLHSSDQDSLELAVIIGEPSANGDRDLSDQDSVVHRAWRTRLPVLGTVDPLERPMMEPQSEEMAAPILWGESCVGVLRVRSKRASPFSREDVNLLGLYAMQAAVALNNSSLLEQVRRDAKTKTMLLHDVNHRVKNNLMRLAEIVRLEKETLGHAQVSAWDVLAGLESRVRGMGNLHSLLSAAHWGALPLGELVTQIVTMALRAAPVTPAPDISIQVPEQSYPVMPEQAAAIALILNELATNSAKYALSASDRSQVRVLVSVARETVGRPRVHLSFRDSGPGWPEEVLGGRRRQVGLHLIEASVRSPLRGELALRNEEGAVAEISFLLALAT